MSIALVYSAWSDFIRALSFDAGWWSFGTWIAGGTAFAATVALGVKARSELVLGGVFIAGPIATVTVFGLLKQFADPEPGCTYDCIGRLVLLGPSGGTLIGWGVGFLLAGLWRLARRRQASVD